MFHNPFKKEKPKRVRPEFSVREISDTKERIKAELRAAIYLYNDDKFIICSVAGMAEYGEPIVLDVNVSDADLGLSLCDKLLDFKVKGSDDRPSGKLEDWNAYCVSGAKSGRSFEQNSMYIRVKTINSAINIEAAPRVSLEKNLYALCSISNGLSHSEIGRAIRKSIKAAGVLRQAGML